MIKKNNHAYSELYKSKNSCVVDFLPGYVLLLPSHTAPQLDQNAKTRQNKILKNREVNGSYLCLQWFDKFWTWSAGNRKRKLCKFTETCMGNLVKMTMALLWLNFFSAVFCNLEPLCALSCFRVKIRENTVYRLQSTDYDGKRQNICPRKARASADSRPSDFWSARTLF